MAHQRLPEVAPSTALFFYRNQSGPAVYITLFYVLGTYKSLNKAVCHPPLKQTLIVDRFPLSPLSCRSAPIPYPLP